MPLSRLASIGEVVSQVSHDLRTPITVIQGVLKYLQGMETNDETLLQCIQMLERSTYRLKGIAEDVLKKYKGQTEEQKVFDLRQVLDGLVQEFSVQAALSRVRFHRRYAAEGILLRGDQQRIERMVSNVIKNGVEAMHYHGDLTVATEVRHGRVQISIQDRGPGITKDMVGRILAGCVVSGRQDGHGIGLSFVKEVLGDHRGTLRIDSTVGAGTTFHLELPMHSPKAQTVALPAEQLN